MKAPGSYRWLPPECRAPRMQLDIKSNEGKVLVAWDVPGAGDGHVQLRTL